MSNKQKDMSEEEYNARQKEIQHLYYLRNKEWMIARNMEYQRANKDKINAKRRERYSQISLAEKVKRSERSKKYYREHREEILEKKKRQRDGQKETH